MEVNKKMTKAKQVHNNYCDYQIDKAKGKRILAVKTAENKKIEGLRTSGHTKAELTRKLANLF